jgi:hypothetical protein
MPGLSNDPAGTAPPPLVPPGMDLSGFDFMPLEVNRLLTSETWIEAADEPKLGHALMCLWCQSWRQVPASSLPNNPQVLARLAMCTPAEWRKIAERALAGWVLCADGRLYHPVVAEKGLEAWIEKLQQRKASGLGTRKRYGQEFDQAALEDAIAAALARLVDLNPNSRALRKSRSPSIDGTPSGGATPGAPNRQAQRGATGTATGTGCGIAGGSAGRVPRDREGTGTGKGDPSGEHGSATGEPSPRAQAPEAHASEAPTGRVADPGRSDASPPSQPPSGTAERVVPFPRPDPRGSRLPPDWEPSPADIQTARDEGLHDDDIRREFAKFRDYWLGKPGAAGRKCDWPGTWRNWIRKAADDLGRGRGHVAGRGPTQDRSQLGAFVRAAARFRDPNALPE